MTPLISLDDPNVKQKIAQLVPTNGYVLMADLVGSTKLKQGRPFTDWVADFLFPFRNLYANIGQDAMKVVGDMAMYWFPESTSPDPEDIMQSLMKVQRESSDGFKMAFVRCQNVYEVTFHKKVPEDVYGSDIDLAARLLAHAKAREIVMDAVCREEIVKRVKGFGVSSEIGGLQSEPFKGFSDPTTFFTWRVPA